MKIPDIGLYIDNPAYPLLKELVSYWGITTANGNAGGTTLVDTGLVTEPGYAGHLVKMLTGNAAGQVRYIQSEVIATGTPTVDRAFTDSAGAAVQIVAGTAYCIMSFDLGSLIGILNHVAQEQTSVAVNITAIAASETNVFNLAVAGTHYIVRNLRLKCADPTAANTITVRLYELVNGVSTLVNSFAIGTFGTPNPFSNYYSLMDMFGMPQLVGSNLLVTVQVAPGAGPYAVTGEYDYATAT